MQDTEGRVIYVRLGCSNEYLSAPDYAAVSVSDALLRRVRNMRALCDGSELSDVRAWDYSLRFGPVNGTREDFRVDCVRLCVSAEDFWWTGLEKYSSSHWATSRIRVADLEQIAADGSGRVAWFGGATQDGDWDELLGLVAEAQEGVEDAQQV